MNGTPHEDAPQQQWTSTTHCIDPATITIDAIGVRPSNILTIAPGVHVTTSDAIHAVTAGDQHAALDAFEQIGREIIREVDSWRSRLNVADPLDQLVDPCDGGSLPSTTEAA